ncbi:hypothetical protein BGZ65_004845, partial [Modicella reniformis]
MASDNKKVERLSGPLQPSSSRNEDSNMQSELDVNPDRSRSIPMRVAASLRSSEDQRFEVAGDDFGGGTRQKLQSPKNTALKNDKSPVAPPLAKDFMPIGARSNVKQGEAPSLEYALKNVSPKEKMIGAYNEAPTTASGRGIRQATSNMPQLQQQLQSDRSDGLNDAASPWLSRQANLAPRDDPENGQSHNERRDFEGLASPVNAVTRSPVSSARSKDRATSAPKQPKRLGKRERKALKKQEAEKNMGVLDTISSMWQGRKKNSVSSPTLHLNELFGSPPSDSPLTPSWDDHRSLPSVGALAPKAAAAVTVLASEVDDGIRSFFGSINHPTSENQANRSSPDQSTAISSQTNTFSSEPSYKHQTSNPVMLWTPVSKINPGLLPEEEANYPRGDASCTTHENPAHPINIRDAVEVPYENPNINPANHSTIEGSAAAIKKPVPNLFLFPEEQSDYPRGDGLHQTDEHAAYPPIHAREFKEIQLDYAQRHPHHDLHPTITETAAAVVGQGAAVVSQGVAVVSQGVEGVKSLLRGIHLPAIDDNSKNSDSGIPESRKAPMDNTWDNTWDNIWEQPHCAIFNKIVSDEHHRRNMDIRPTVTEEDFEEHGFPARKWGCHESQEPRSIVPQSDPDVILRRKSEPVQVLPKANNNKGIPIVTSADWVRSLPTAPPFKFTGNTVPTSPTTATLGPSTTTTPMYASFTASKPPVAPTQTATPTARRTSLPSSYTSTDGTKDMTPSFKRTALSPQDATNPFVALTARSRANPTNMTTAASTGGGSTTVDTAAREAAPLMAAAAMGAKSDEAVIMNAGDNGHSYHDHQQSQHEQHPLQHLQHQSEQGHTHDLGLEGEEEEDEKRDMVNELSPAQVYAAGHKGPAHGVAHSSPPVSNVTPVHALQQQQEQQNQLRGYNSHEKASRSEMEKDPILKKALTTTVPSAPPLGTKTTGSNTAAPAVTTAPAPRAAAQHQCLYPPSFKPTSGATVAPPTATTVPSTASPIQSATNTAGTSGTGAGATMPHHSTDQQPYGSQYQHQYRQQPRSLQNQQTTPSAAVATEQVSEPGTTAGTAGATMPHHSTDHRPYG